MSDLLLMSPSLPIFSKIDPKRIVPDIIKVLSSCKVLVENILKRDNQSFWEDLYQPLSESDNVLCCAFSPIDHLHSVKDSPELRKSYEKIISLISEYNTWINQNEELFKVYSEFRNGKNYALLNKDQKKAVNNRIRNFKLSGVGLNKIKKKDLKKLIYVCRN